MLFTYYAIRIFVLKMGINTDNSEFNCATHTMVRLKIQNVGSVKNGFDANEGFINFTGVTLFTGSQGSGKSTIAKVFSTVSWIEKALVRGDFTESHLTSLNRFKEELDYQGIRDYLSDNSVIQL